MIEAGTGCFEKWEKILFGVIQRREGGILQLSLPRIDDEGNLDWNNLQCDVFTFNPPNGSEGALVDYEWLEQQEGMRVVVRIRHVIIKGTDRDEMKQVRFAFRTFDDNGNEGKREYFE